ncbi:MAG TPA: ABC transporter permease [Candidatus Bathyarchaeia archaeon]|nr:ABC transporter permease [Candidatus Bathyarchaeia archaeon]
MAPYNPFDTTGASFVPPGSKYVLGTDDLGRDLLSQLLYGIRTSALVGGLAAFIAAMLGIVIGALAGYYGGVVDDTLSRITEVFLIIPGFFLALLIISFYGRSIWYVAIILGILSWPQVARITRGEFFQVRESSFVESARAIGASNRQIVFKEILPNAISPAIVAVMLQIPRAIILEAGLSYLGLWDPSTISLGYLLYSSREFYFNAWWLAMFPALALFAVTLAFNLAGDRVNEELNPKIRNLFFSPIRMQPAN